MKIKYEKVITENIYIMNQCIFKFKIVSSILKKHYKELARMSMLFNNREQNTGFIEKRDEQQFLDLVAIIESSNDARCATSHKNAIEKAKNRKNTVSFEDYCEDYLDMSIYLMSDKEKEEAYSSYKTL
jgi:hypothetical protein